MRVTPPISITDTEFTSSTAAEPHAPSAYAGGTTYGLGDIVKVTADFAIYESLKAANTGNTPSTSPLWWRQIGTTETLYNVGTTYALGDVCYSSTYHRCYESLAAGNIGNPLPVPPETTTTKWEDVGPTNKWAMFDLKSNTQTVCASPLTVVITPGQRINTVGLTGIEANTAVISATSAFGGGAVFSETIDLNTREVVDAYTYFFEPFSTAAATVVFDVPPFSDIVITITLTATSGNVKCGSCVIGTYVYLGKLQRGFTNDHLNFSSVTRDLYGNATLVQRLTAPQNEHVLRLPKEYVNKARAARILLNAAPALWTGLDDDTTSDWFETLLITGVYNKFSINGAQNNMAEINLKVEEI